jgi:hypothetical protein
MSDDTAVTRDQLLASLAEGTVTVWTKGENVGYVDEPTEVDLSIYICDVCGRTMSEHNAGGPGPHAHFPDDPSDGWRCPPEDTPAS